MWFQSQLYYDKSATKDNSASRPSNWWKASSISLLERKQKSFTKKRLMFAKLKDIVELEYQCYNTTLRNLFSLFPPNQCHCFPFQILDSRGLKASPV